jgi:hypothetical protein
VVVARDGDRYFALVAWVPEAGGGRALEEIDALEAAVSLSGLGDTARHEAVDAANLQLPHLSVRAIQALVESSGPASPPELFRRAAATSARGIAALPAPAGQELQALMAAALGSLPRKQRAQLAEYLGRVGAGQASLPEEDAQMLALMQAAAARLGPAQRARLGELNEAAIRGAQGG